MKRTIVLAAGLGLLAAACGQRGAESLGPAPVAEESPEPAPTASPEPTTEPAGEPGETVTYEVWFAAQYSLTGEAGNVITREGLFLTKRTQEATPAVGRAALTALLEGPTPEEAAAGVFTAVPPGTELLGLSIGDGVATVDLSEEFASGGDSASVLTRLAQVVYTITQFPAVDGVELLIEGSAPDPAFSAEGVVLEGPQTRADWEDHLPPIVVESPLIGEAVSSPVTIAGTANVYEATVSIRILDAGGDEIARTFTTATCGSGCRGDYSASVKYRVASEQEGTIEVSEASALDGVGPQNLVRIPVTLSP